MTTLSSASRHDLLNKIWQDIKRYREQPMLIWDSRDHGNFSGSYLDQKRDTLRHNDPNSLCEGLLLDVMIEGILSSTKVTLDTLFNQPDPLPALKEIMHIKAQLHQIMGEDLSFFLDRVAGVFNDIKPISACPDKTIIAICLRDAIYSLSSGLNWSWLDHDNAGPLEPIRLNKAVLQFDSMTAFTDALRTELPYGAHLVSVKKQVVLSVKQPGRVGYLSALRLSEHTGTYEHVNDAYSFRTFDFDIPANRFPSWSDFTRDRNTPAPADLHPSVWGSLTDMPDATVIWLVLLTDMLSSKLDGVSVPAEALIDVASRALPGAQSRSTLPALLQPRFSLAPITLEWGLERLGFTLWEKQFVTPLLNGLDADFFLPTGAGKQTVPIPARYATVTARTMEFICFDPDLIGCEARLNEVRRTVFLKNLAHFALTVGNNLLDQTWSILKNEWKPLVAKRVKKSLPANTALIPAEKRDHAAMVIYKQNTKRVQFAPLCLFDERTPATHYLMIVPNDSVALSDLLGIAHDLLPDWLKGWARTSGTWTCDDGLQPDCPENIQTHVRRWRFSTEPMFSAVVATTESTGRQRLKQ